MQVIGWTLTNLLMGVLAEFFGVTGFTVPPSPIALSARAMPKE